MSCCLPTRVRVAIRIKLSPPIGSAQHVGVTSFAAAPVVETVIPNVAAVGLVADDAAEQIRKHSLTPNAKLARPDGRSTRRCGSGKYPIFKILGRMQSVRFSANHMNSGQPAIGQLCPRGGLVPEYFECAARL